MAKKNDFVDVIFRFPMIQLMTFISNSFQISLIVLTMTDKMPPIFYSFNRILGSFIISDIH